MSTAKEGAVDPRQAGLVANGPIQAGRGCCTRRKQATRGFVQYCSRSDLD